MRKVLLLFIVILAFISCREKNTTRIDLSGDWLFQIDSSDVGIQQEWFQRSLAETVQLPGSMATNDKGNEVSVSTKWTGGIFDSSW